MLIIVNHHPRGLIFILLLNNVNIRIWKMISLRLRFLVLILVIEVGAAKQCIVEALPFGQRLLRLYLFVMDILLMVHASHNLLILLAIPIWLVNLLALAVISLIVRVVITLALHLLAKLLFNIPLISVLRISAFTPLFILLWIHALK